MPGLFEAALLVALSLAPDSAPADTLDAITVSATRLPESLERAPAALSIVGRGTIADTRGLSLDAPLNGVPGVFAQSRAGGQDVGITIRGFGARGNGERSNSGNIRGVRVLVDGIPLTEPDGRTSLDLVDLGSAGRIEVSRSNASVLFGNASGGVINLRSDLDFPAPYLEFRERAGSFGYHREQLVGGFTVGDRSRGSASLLNSTFDGWREHSMSTSLQGQLRLRTRVGDGDDLGVLIDAVNNMNRFPGPLTASQADSAPAMANPDFVARDERRHNRIGRIALTYTGDIAAQQDLDLTFFVEPKVLERSERNSYRDFNRYHIGGSATYAWRTAIRPGLESRFSLGADDALQDGSILFYNLTPDGGRGSELKANKREGANALGFFVQEEIAWNERWSLRGALRVDALRYDSEDRIDPELNAEKTFEQVTPKAALSYSTGRHFFFAALGGGVETPAFNEIDPPPGIDSLTSLNPLLEPMRSTTFELGARGKLPIRSERRDLGEIRYDLAAYWIEIENEIVPYDGGAYFLSAGRSRRKGLEAGLDWLLAGGLRIGGALTLSSNHYIEYRNELGDFSGNETPGLPAAVLTASARYASEIGVEGEIETRVVDSYYADDANTAQAGSYSVLNVMLAYGREIGRLSCRAHAGVENLTDRGYIGSVYINGLDGEYYEPALPRNWSFGLTLRWR